eukprot:IDg16046t1
MGSFAGAELQPDTRNRTTTTATGCIADTLRTSAAHRQRELYLQMKREDDPEFSFITPEELRAAVNTGTGTASSTVPARLLRDVYTCTTQETPTLEAALRAAPRGVLPIWARGSVLRWAARADGYPAPGLALRVAALLQRAATRWNNALDGRVTLRYAARPAD